MGSLVRSEFTKTKSVHSDGQREDYCLHFTDGESLKEGKRKGTRRGEDREGEGEKEEYKTLFF